MQTQWPRRRTFVTYNYTKWPAHTILTHTASRQPLIHVKRYAHIHSITFKDGCTALQVAVQGGFTDVVIDLLGSNPDVNAAAAVMSETQICHCIHGGGDPFHAWWWPFMYIIFMVVVTLFMHIIFLADWFGASF